MRMFTCPSHLDILTPTIQIMFVSWGIYGLKQAPRAWNKNLKQALLLYAFVTSCSDTSLFIYEQGTSTILLLVYVDVMIITGNDISLIVTMIYQLESMFALKDLGRLSYFLCNEVSYLPAGVLLTRTKYVEDL